MELWININTKDVVHLEEVRPLKRWFNMNNYRKYYLPQNPDQNRGNEKVNEKVEHG